MRHGGGNFDIPYQYDENIKISSLFPTNMMKISKFPPVPPVSLRSFTSLADESDSESVEEVVIFPRVYQSDLGSLCSIIRIRLHRTI